MVRREIICVLGNRATGKTTLCALINSRHHAVEPNLLGIDSCAGPSLKLGLDTTHVDRLVFEYTFDEEHFDSVNLPDKTDSGENVYWLVLDCQVEALLERTASNPNGDIYLTEKALRYYQQRYRQLSAHFGIPLVDTTNRAPEQLLEYVVELVRVNTQYYRYYRQIRCQTLSFPLIEAHDVENKLYELIDEFDWSHVVDLPEYADEVGDVDKKRIYVRFYLNRNPIVVNGETSTVRIGKYELPIESALFRLVNEGESKRIYRDVTRNPFTLNLAFIVLKSTIYSHSMQRTGEIGNLGSVRARACQLFLEMMWRNEMKHSYRAVNTRGIIISDFVDEIPPIEVIVKRFCEGTDKNSYSGILENGNIVLGESEREYLSGPYVRLDWRNPNHLSVATRLPMTRSPCYYLYEQAVGKEEFFRRVLSDRNRSIPMGDKNISEDLLPGVVDLTQTKMSVLKVFAVIQAYFTQVDLLIKDACFMLDRAGRVFWSEINQDCMRVTNKLNCANKFDKDIWRSGGAGSREDVLRKWNLFNDMFVDYFAKNKFHETELLSYNSYFYQGEVDRLLSDDRLRIPSDLRRLWLNILKRNPRRVLLTMDIFNRQPVLVRSSEVSQVHSDGNCDQAMEKISIFADVLLVDLNRAFDPTDRTNDKILRRLAQKHYVHSGGGLRCVDDVNEMLRAGVRRCVLASADLSVIERLPTDRLIIEISVNDKDEVLVNARRTNTRQNVLDKIRKLIDLGIDVISITFVKAEGQMAGLCREQIRNLVFRIPRQIRKIYIAGGVTSLDDLDYLWSFERVIPVVGSALWRDQVSVADLFNRMIRFDERGLVSSVIQDKNGQVKGLCYMNKESVERTCESRSLHRYSRRLQRVILKGETSGHTQPVVQISLDCDSDSILVVVDSVHPFCHTGSFSCFNLQTSIKANLGQLAQHIKSRMNTHSYTGLMQANGQRALAKIIEEYWEVVSASEENRLSECADLLVHLLMYLNSVGLSVEDVANELNRRRWAPKTSAERSHSEQRRPDEIVIGITSSKYMQKTDRFALDELGIRIVRHSGRSLMVQGEITDRDKFTKYFPNCDQNKLSLMPCKPKDMVSLLALRRVTHLITFQSVVESCPRIYSTIHEIVDPTICLALISRRGERIEPEKWSADNKALIATEYIRQVAEFFQKNNMRHDQYHLDKISGTSEAFLVNNHKYLLADAIIETGATLKDNQLDVWRVIIPNGQMHIGLYGYPS